MVDRDEDRDLLAGELALRLLSPVEEAAARARQARDPAFAAEVDAWSERLGQMVESAPSEEPSPALWARLSAVIGSANDNLVIFWRRWAVGSSALLAASLGALIFLAARPDQTPVAASSPTPPAVTRVATLTVEGGGMAATLIYDPVTGGLFVQPAAPMPPGRVPHLWLVMDDGVVRLVGPVDGASQSRHRLSGGMEIMAGRAQAVAISMEAPGHTPPVDKPDGPVIASGAFQPV